MATNPTFAVGTGLTELSFASASLTVNRGTYTSGLCIMPAGTGVKFNSDITFTIAGTTFVTSPATMVAK